MKKILLYLSVSVLILTTPLQAFAAAPDGLGPWADSVVASSQANTKGGTPVSVVNPARSNPTSAVGVAENNTIDSNFFSLGFGGSITLGFINGISSGVLVIEATNPGYPFETAKVEVSQNGVTFLNAGNVSQDGTVSIPQEVGCARFVRITDTSNPADFSESTADAYDVDGVQAQGEECKPPKPALRAGCSVRVVNINNANISNTVNSTVNTGGNSSNGNTVGGNIITGNANSNTTIQNTVNQNTTIVNQVCSSGGVARNRFTGPGSVNIARISN